METILQQYDLEGLKQGIGQLFPKHNISLEQLLSQVFSGDVTGALENLLRGLASELTDPCIGAKNLLVWLLTLGLISSLLTHFAEVLEVHQVAEISYYFSYLLFVTVLLKCFSDAANEAVETMEQIALFIKLLAPSYLLTVGLALGTTRAALTCQVLLLVIYGVERLLIGILVPFLYSYLMLSVINGIWPEEKLTLLTDLMEKVTGWIQKGAIGVVTGISLFQSLIVPVIDTAKHSVLQKAISMIPGVGDVAEGAIQMVIGSALAVKNSVGVVLMLLMIFLCAVPLIRIALTAVALKLAAAFLGMVSDKRLSTCTNRAGDAGLLLLKTIGTGILLFFIAMAVVTASVRR